MKDGHSEDAAAYRESLDHQVLVEQLIMRPKSHLCPIIEAL
jgi:hypothetical protein